MAWVSERKDVLSGLFFMLTLAAYLGYVRHPFSWLRYLSVVVLMALGLMAKPMLVTLPLVLLLLDYWPLGRVQWPLRYRENRRLVLEKLPLLALAAASCVITALAQGAAVERLARLPLSFRVGNALVSYVTYIEQFFYPVGLAAYYPHPAAGLPEWKIIGRIAAPGCHLRRACWFGGGVPLPGGRLVLVPGHARAGDRVDAGRGPGHGRSLHLLARDRVGDRPGLGG